MPSEFAWQLLPILAGAFITWVFRKPLGLLFWKMVGRCRLRWQRWKQRKNVERIETENYLNEWVELESGEYIHRGCAAKEDVIIEHDSGRKLIAPGRCKRCGEHGSMPRR